MLGSFRAEMILDLGCGKNKHAGAIGMDNVALATVDVLHDLRSIPYPFVSDCAAQVIASHVLEHFSFSEISGILTEIWRLLRPEGTLTISVPHAGSIAAFTDPTHKTFFTFGSFYYLTAQHPLGYYQEIQVHWKLERMWASVNLFNNQLHPETRWQLALDHLVTRMLRRLIRLSRTLTLPELVVKIFPFWLVSIHVRLAKK